MNFEQISLLNDEAEMIYIERALENRVKKGNWKKEWKIRD